MVLYNNELWQKPVSGAGGFYDYQIEQSMIQNAGTVAYLSRTFGTATSRDIFTVSLWIKRHTDLDNGSASTIFTGGTSGSQYSFTGFSNSNQVQMDLQTTMGSTGSSDQQFEDFSAWYHLLYRFDTTQSSQDDRIRVYVNGTQLTGYNLGNVSQNEDVPHWTAAEPFYIGQKNGIGHASDGTNNAYAEFLFFDGQSYAPTEVAQSKNGIWIPKNPSGLSFGNNGFHLKFAEGAIGTDSSGNGNNFTATNIDNDNITLDSPTNGAGST
tara:strand:+ start:537 stop:1337 length:801 start_codon:yes stop_codon:yes gene_type:complete